MKTLICLLLLPALLHAQTSNEGRQLVTLTIKYEPDAKELEGEYYLIADKPSCVQIKPNQTFLLQSAWHESGDSIVSIGTGTAKIINDTNVELSATLYPGKKIRKGDMALFLVPLLKPLHDTLFFKMARLDITFTTIGDSTFYERERMLQAPADQPTNRVIEAMAKDIQFTGESMMKVDSSLNRNIEIGRYKGQRLLFMMQQATADDVLRFMSYVYARPDKYKAHSWKVSETFATWVINGAPEVLKK